MRVLALVPDAFGGRGGIALYNRNVLRALCEHAATTAVVAIPRLAPYALEGIPDKLDFRVNARDSKTRFALETIRTLATDNGFDLVLAGHLNLLPLAHVARAWCRAPLVVFLYGMDAWSPRDRVTGPLVGRVDACIAIRQYSLDRLRDWASMPARCHVLENAIHLSRYHPGAGRPDLVDAYGLGGKRVLLTVSRLDAERQGVDEVLEMLPTLLKELPNIAYLVVGSGPQTERLRSKAAALGVRDHVVFTGGVPDVDLPAHYRLAHAFTMPGSAPRFDRYPLRFVFLEALASGLPVVASRPEEHDEMGTSPVPLDYVDPSNQSEAIAKLVDALKRGPGSVPPELHRYDYPAFRSRLHALVDGVVAKS